MGSTIKMEEIETSVNFVPSDPTLPIELFLAIMEHSTCHLTDIQRIERAMSKIDKTTAHFDDLDEKSEWNSFKELMVRHFKRAPTLPNVVEMLKSLVKGKNEHSQHFLIRVKYFIQMARTLCSSGNQGSINIDYLCTLLFLAGLSQYETDYCFNGDVLAWPEIEVLADMVESEFKQLKEEEEEVEVGEQPLSPDELESDFDEYKSDQSSFEKCDKEQPDNTSRAPIMISLLKPVAETKMETTDAFEQQDSHGLDDDMKTDTLSEEPQEKYTQIMESKIFVCTEEGCTAQFNTRGGQLGHIHDSHTHKDKFKCDECDFKTSRKTSLKFHVQTRHQGISETVKCDVCSKEVRKHNLRRHKKLHSTTRDTFQCEDCGGTYTTKAILKNHKEKHCSKNTSESESDTAGPEKAFPSGGKKRKRRRPVIKNDPSRDDKCYQWCVSEGMISVKKGSEISNRLEYRSLKDCGICGQSFESNSAYLEHVDSEHDGKRFKCDLCSAIYFRTFFGLQNHKINDHDVDDGKVTVYFCRVDGCTFKSVHSGNTVTHVNVEHLGKGGFLCQLCGKSFRSKDYERRHFEKVHQKVRKPLEFQCPECPRAFYDKGNMKKHMDVKHGSKEDRKKHSESRKKVTCDQCGLKFQTNAHVNIHIQIVHQKIKPYRCKICNIFFSMGSNLKEHIGLKHMGYKNGKEWRSEENKATRQAASKHEAFEYIPLDVAKTMTTK